MTRFFFVSMLAAAIAAMTIIDCSGGAGEQGDAQTDVANGSDAPATSDATSDGGTSSDGAGNPLALACAQTKQAVAPNACPAPSGAAGQASFCFRAQLAGVTSVDVYGGFGQSGDWKSAFVTLTNDGTGTFTATTALANGNYPYLFKVTGAADGLFKNSTWLLDQESTQFMPAPPAAPIQRSVPVVTVPQPASPTLNHLRGKVVYDGAPQPCFTVSIDVGELYKDGGSAVLSEQSTANYAESASDGTFDFPVASAQVMAVVRYPFLLSDLDAGYPDPQTARAIGYARTVTGALGTGDVMLDPVEVSYSKADYAAMSPTNGAGTLPQTFGYTVVPGSTSASVAVIGTSIAGNDPAYWSAFGSATSLTWDGGFGNGGGVAAGTRYWWGTWQKRALVDGGMTWSEESLLFPITF